MQFLPYPLTLVRDAGFKVFSDFNFVVLRARGSRPGMGDDTLYTARYNLDEGYWKILAFQAETQPGQRYIERPNNPDGVACIVPGQYRGAYRLGTHKGRPAFRQAGPITVYRDNDRDQVLELDPVTAQSGIFYTNVHDVAPWSALEGCIGIAPPAMPKLLAEFQEARNQGHGETFTLTLLQL